MVETSCVLVKVARDSGEVLEELEVAGIIGSPHLYE